MGLTLHYGLSTALRSEAKIVKMLNALHDAAVDFQKRGIFQEVGEVIYFPEGETDGQNLDDGGENYWMLIQAGKTLWEGNIGYDVRPVRGYIFRVYPGHGCENANFGLMLYPATIEADGKTLKTGISGWYWKSFCKTQYANQHGTPHFLKCHIGLCSLLDIAQSLGFKLDIYDEGGFWENRDPKALANEVAEWDREMAALIGAIGDALGWGELESHIQSYSNFEQLETEGRLKLSDNFLNSLVSIQKQIEEAQFNTVPHDVEACVSWYQLFQDRVDEEIHAIWQRDFEGKYPSEINPEAFIKAVERFLDDRD